MSKTLSSLLTIVFLGAQMFSFAHAAEYGSQEHEHEGIACEICLSAKYQDFSTPGTTNEVRVLHRAQHVPQPPIEVIFVRDAYDAGITRGPPLSS